MKVGSGKPFVTIDKKSIYNFLAGEFVNQKSANESSNYGRRLCRNENGAKS